MRTPSFRKMKGQIAILTGFLLLVLVGSVGLAIDSGLGYIIRAKLHGAVDAAAIAGARAVVIGSSQAEQTASAKIAATRFFEANYVDGYMNSTPTLSNINVAFNQGQINVDVAASARVPVNLMGIFGFDILSVGARAEAIRRDVDMAFVVDTTGSLVNFGNQVKAASKSFLSQFNAKVDRVALMHFSSGGVLDVGFKSDFTRGFDRGGPGDTDPNGENTMYRKINGYRFEGWTNYAEGLWHARSQLNSVPASSRSSLRVIVFFSDGSPNTIASFYNFRTSSACTKAGAIASGEAATGRISGLFNHETQAGELTGVCWDGIGGGRPDPNGYGIENRFLTAALPAYYNAHSKTDQTFRFAPNPTSNPSGLRTVSTAPTYTNINNASRNVAEEMAWQSRSEGVYIFTLGLGYNLSQRNGPNNELGSDVLNCMANTSDAPLRCRTAGAGQPIGEYCYAATTADLEPCFSRLASRILRLSK